MRRVLGSNPVKSTRVLYRVGLIMKTAAAPKMDLEFFMLYIRIGMIKFLTPRLKCFI